MKQKTTKTPLELLTEQSQNAINLVVATIEKLRHTNKAIDEEKSQNDETIVYLQNENTSLVNLKLGNERIINNFEKLLQ